MYKKSKYTKEQTQEMKVAIIDALASNPIDEYLNLDDIRARSIILKNATNQKISRILNEMAEMGFISKGSKEKRVAYKSNGTIIV